MKRDATAALKGTLVKHSYAVEAKKTTKPAKRVSGRWCNCHSLPKLVFRSRTIINCFYDIAADGRLRRRVFIRSRSITGDTPRRRLRPDGAEQAEKPKNMKDKHGMKADGPSQLSLVRREMILLHSKSILDLLCRRIAKKLQPPFAPCPLRLFLDPAVFCKIRYCVGQRIIFKDLAVEF